jgi:hypothetical protein
MSPYDVISEALRNPADWLIVREDCVAEGASNVPNTLMWDVVKDASAATTIEADQHGGVMLLSSAATTDNDGNLVQSLNEFWKPTSGKRFAFRCFIKSADADQQDVFVGLAQRAGTNPENTLAASNRIGFQVDDGNASILCKSEATDVETSKDSEVDLADDTYKELALSYDGNGRLSFYVDRQGVATIESNVPATELAIALFQLSGNASGTHTMRVKRIIAVSEM